MTLRETLEHIRSMETPTNEQSTITRIIMPVLEQLGWDIRDRNGNHEVEEQYPVSGLKGSGKVDIALMRERGQCICLVEAKSPGVNLNDHVIQLFRYDASCEDSTICVLTDGLEWRLFLPRETGKPEERQFVRLRLKEDPIEQVADSLEVFLSRSAVLSGKAQEDAVQTLKKLREERKRSQEEQRLDQQLPDILREMLTEPDEELVELVRSRVEAQLGFRPSAAKVAKVLVKIAPSLKIAPSQTGFDIELVRSGDKSIAGQRKIVGATLFGVHKSLSDDAIEVLDFVAVQLYKRHGQDLLDKVSRISSKAVQISRDRSDIKRPREIGIPGIYIYANLKRTKIIARSKEWLRLMGHSDSDLEIQYA